MFDIMNEMSELIYVVDINTYDLLFINTAAKEMFHIDEIQGLKCYKALKGLDSPCSFCKNSMLSFEKTNTWEHSNSLVKRHYLLKNRLVNWNGIHARIEIAFDITEKENEKIALEHALAAEYVIMECVKQLYWSKKLSETIPNILQKIGIFLSADRTYIFEIHDNKMSNTYEWCSKHVTPQIRNSQNLDVSLIDHWKIYFSNHECFIIRDLNQIKENNPVEYRHLAEQGVHCLVAAPLYKDDELIGFIGVDNPPIDKICNITSLLQTLHYFLMASIRREENEQTLFKLSYYDTLTDSYNRNRYMIDIAELSRLNVPLGIVYVDINGLKNVNDQFGHSHGDEILKNCAQKIRNIFGSERSYRVGGDEFTVLYQSISKKEFLHLVMQLKIQFELDPTCQAAIGYHWANVSCNIHHLISIADTMMYENKKHHYRNHLPSKRYRYRNDDVLGLTQPNVLQKMIQNNRFLIYLQPKVSLHDRTVVGAEALIRYKSAKNSIIAPQYFLPVLEEAKLISIIDFYALECACLKLLEWSEQGKSIVPISVNFSRYSLLENNFIHHLLSTCEKYGIQKKWLEIEITEDVAGMEGFDLNAFAVKMRTAGFTTAIDDFGIYYANLSLLISLDFDKLKLDKNLIHDISTNPKTQSVVGALSRICNDMKLHTTVEGVETEDQFAILKHMGFEQAQGYLISRPLPPEEYEAKFMNKIHLK